MTRGRLPWKLLSILTRRSHTIALLNQMKLDPLFPTLPYEVAIRCLVLVPWQCHGALLLVNRRWSRLVLHGELHEAREAAGVKETLVSISNIMRSLNGRTQQVHCLVFNPLLPGVKPRALPRLQIPPKLNCCKGVPGNGVAFLLFERFGRVKQTSGLLVVFDFAKGAWKVGIVNGVDESVSAGVTAGNEVILLTGDYAVGGGRNRIERVSLTASGTYVETLPKLLHSRRRCTIVEQEGLVVVAGGNVEWNCGGEIEVYNPRSKVWSQKGAPFLNNCVYHEKLAPIRAGLLHLEKVSAEGANFHLHYDDGSFENVSVPYKHVGEEYDTAGIKPGELLSINGRAYFALSWTGPQQGFASFTLSLDAVDLVEGNLRLRRLTATVTSHQLPDWLAVIEV